MYTLIICFLLFIFVMFPSPILPAQVLLPYMADYVLRGRRTELFFLQPFIWSGFKNALFLRKSKVLTNLSKWRLAFPDRSTNLALLFFLIRSEADTKFFASISFITTFTWSTCLRTLFRSNFPEPSCKLLTF